MFASVIVHLYIDTRVFINALDKAESDNLSIIQLQCIGFMANSKKKVSFQNNNNSKQVNKAINN